MIKTVTAPEHVYMSGKEPSVFLAGGICNCPDWQKRVISYLIDGEKNLSGSTIILNPRRENFEMNPHNTEKQIEWEFDMLEKCTCFTMYFSGGESDQPICMYELGRNIERMKQKFPEDWMERIVITCDTNYKRFDDVVKQVELATDGNVYVYMAQGYEESIKLHSEEVFNMVGRHVGFYL